jgi:hypothetical protein
MGTSEVVPMGMMGQWIEVDYKLQRRYQEGDHNALSRDKWPRNFWGKSAFKNPLRVMICGERTLADGRVEYPGSYDEGIVFHPDSHFKALMVVKDMRSKPFFVRADDFQIDPMTGRVVKP